MTGSKLVHVPGDLAFRRQIPERSFQASQGEHRGDPRLCPSRFRGPDSPTPVRIACPVIPDFEIEGPEPHAIEFGVDGRAGLDPAQEFRQLVLRLQIERVAGGGSGLMQAEEGKVRGIEKVAGRVAVLLDQRTLRWFHSVRSTWAGRSGFAPGRSPRAARRTHPERRAELPPCAAATGDARGYPPRAPATPAAAACGRVPAGCRWSTSIGRGKHPGSCGWRSWCGPGIGRHGSCRRPRDSTPTGKPRSEAHS